MPQIIGTVTEDSGSITTNYKDVVTSATQTFTFLTQQDGMSFVSKGSSVVSLTINGNWYKVPPFGIIQSNDNITSFDVVSSNAQPFEITSFRLKNDIRDVESFSSQLTESTQQTNNIQQLQNLQGQGVNVND